jgi:hypothetical protein
MCYSPCFIQATRTAFTPQVLLQCRTCGLQAFHVLDCCRNPDYARVPTSQFVHRLKRWLGRVKTSAQAWRPQLRQRFERSAPPEALDAWETRSITVTNPNHMSTSEDLEVQQVDGQREREAVSAHR